MYMPEISKTVMGGTMRLGTRRCILSSNKCLASRLYGGVTSVDERHRHRYAARARAAERHFACGGARRWAALCPARSCAGAVRTARDSNAARSRLPLVRTRSVQHPSSN